MPVYTLTVYEKSGEKLLDENFEAADEKEAKILGMDRLKKQDFHEKTHRCVNSSGKLILFHR